MYRKSVVVGQSARLFKEYDFPDSKNAKEDRDVRE